MRSRYCALAVHVDASRDAKNDSMPRALEHLEEGFGVNVRTREEGREGILAKRYAASVAKRAISPSFFRAYPHHTLAVFGLGTATIPLGEWTPETSRPTLSQGTHHLADTSTDSRYRQFGSLQKSIPFTNRGPNPTRTPPPRKPFSGGREGERTGGDSFFQIYIYIYCVRHWSCDCHPSPWSLIKYETRSHTWEAGRKLSRKAVAVQLRTRFHPPIAALDPRALKPWAKESSEGNTPAKGSTVGTVPVPQEMCSKMNANPILWSCAHCWKGETKEGPNGRRRRGKERAQ